MMDLYKYTALSPSADCVRLLRLLPGTDKAEIRCQLFHHSLQGASGIHYEALSYVWGPIEPRRKILVENSYLEVTPNLYNALLQLRRPEEDRILWIDAVCINQVNFEERALQVERMAMIYSLADCVPVWLGPEYDGSAIAFDAILRAARNRQNEESPSLEDQNDLTRENEEKVLRKPTPEAAALFNLLRRPYFSRIWVLQEVAAAKYTVFLCGPQELEGTLFCEGIRQLSKSHAGMVGVLDSLSYLVTHASKSTQTIEGSARLNILPLRVLVEMFHSNDATDRRDKIFALLGMSSEDSLRIRVDYTRPWSELFRELVHNIVGQKVKVLTWEDDEVALIQGFGCVLGRVDHVGKHPAFEKHDTIAVTSNVFRGPNGRPIEWKAVWSIYNTVKPIRKGDVVCLLEGASEPSIVRLRNLNNPRLVYFSVIALSVGTPSVLHFSGLVPGLITWKEFKRLIVIYNRTFVLSWDWTFDRALQGPRQWRKGQPRKNPAWLRSDPFEEFSTNPYDVVRIGDLVLVFDDLRDQQIVAALLETYVNLQPKYEIHMAHIASQFKLYQWLKVELESIFWEFWLLKGERIWRSKMEDFIALYTEGHTPIGIFEISNLVTGSQPFPSSRTWSSLSPATRTMSNQFAQLLSARLSYEESSLFPQDWKTRLLTGVPEPVLPDLKKQSEQDTLRASVSFPRKMLHSLRKAKGDWRSPSRSSPSTTTQEDLQTPTEDPPQQLVVPKPEAEAHLANMELHFINVHRLLVLLKPARFSDPTDVYSVLKAIAMDNRKDSSSLKIPQLDLLDAYFGKDTTRPPAQYLDFKRRALDEGLQYLVSLFKRWEYQDLKKGGEGTEYDLPEIPDYVFPDDD